MLPVYICEDEDAIRQHISRHITNFYTIHQEYEQPDISSFSKPADLLAALSDTSSMGIYLLDIELNSDMNGLELARAIRNRDPKGFIVFITSHVEYAPTSLKLQVEAFDYIDKCSPELKSTLSCTLMKIHERHALFQENSFDNPRLHFKSSGCLHYFFADDLIALITSDQSHRIKIFTTDSSIDLNGTLSSFKKNLPETHFFQCHRSCIINKRHVFSYDPETHMVEMSNHIKLPVAREKRSYFLS